MAPAQHSRSPHNDCLSNGSNGQTKQDLAAQHYQLRKQVQAVQVYCLLSIVYCLLSPPSSCMGPRGLTFTWWGCCGSCQGHTSTELAYSFLICSCVYFCLMTLLTVFHSINSADNSPLSHSVLPALILLRCSFQLYISYECLPKPFI